MKECEGRLCEDLRVKKPLTMSRKGWEAYSKERDCYICEKLLARHNVKNAMDVYDQNTGAYYGQIHRKTNGCSRLLYKHFYHDEQGELQQGQLYGPQNNASQSQKEKKARTVSSSVSPWCMKSHIRGQYRGAAHWACHVNHYRINPDKVVTRWSFTTSRATTCI